MSISLPPFREVPYLPVRLKVETRDDGSVTLDNLNPLRPGPAHMLAPLAYWGGVAPDRLWLAQRDPTAPDAGGWQELTYGQGWARVRAIAQGLIDRGVAGQDAPVMILSRNSVEHALVSYGAQLAGCPVCPMTPAHAMQAREFSRLQYAVDLVRPAAFFVEEGAPFQRAIDAVAGGRPVIFARDMPQRCEAVALDALTGCAARSDVDLAYDRLEGGWHAKYLLTSGSTGTPKAVILTHGNIATNVKMIRSVWDVERLEAISGQQVMVSFLPWSHSLGANAILHSMTDWGGALYIDWGAPTPAKMAEMVRNLGEARPTQHTTVPAAWAMIATELERDEAFAQAFFSRLLVMSYGGAAMGQDLYERIQAVAVRVTGQRISLSAGYGATETTPTASNVHWPNDTMGLIGLPVPGSRFRMAPVGQKMELRCKGPHIMAGYLRDPERTAAAFDAEGWFCLGDAVRLADPARPEAGLVFDGRIAEEFKLASGTWVSAGNVRVGVVEACEGALSDAVVCGLNETEITLIGFLDTVWCQRAVGEALSLPELVRHDIVRRAIAQGLARYNSRHPEASARVARICLEPTPPSLTEGEITEKGYLNQARIRETRSDSVARLYDNARHDDIFNPLQSV